LFRDPQSATYGSFTARSGHRGGLANIGASPLRPNQQMLLKLMDSSESRQTATYALQQTAAYSITPSAKFAEGMPARPLKKKVP
jgi:hypothetical protein